MLQYSFIGILAYEYTQNHSYGNIVIYLYLGIRVLRKRNILAHGCFNVFNIFVCLL